MRAVKRKAFRRGALGFPLGITVGYVITILTSLIWGQGYYAPCVPQLVQTVGNEISAVILQAGLCGVIGAACAAGSVIWEMERWGLVKQTGLYFLILFVVMMPVAYFMYWMDHSVQGVLGYFCIFAAIFFAIWLTEYWIGRRNVAKMNSKLSE